MGRKANKNQWWELYDENTKRYYYNNKDKKSVWKRPTNSNVDVIPLRKLQDHAKTTQIGGNNNNNAQNVQQNNQNLNNSFQTSSYNYSNNYNLDRPATATGQYPGFSFNQHNYYQYQNNNNNVNLNNSVA